MGINSRTNPRPRRTRSEYELNASGLVGRTFSLWRRKLPIYVAIVGLVGVALALFQAIILFLIFGLPGFALLEFIGTSTLDTIFSLVFYNIPNIIFPLIALTLIGLLVYVIVGGAAIKYALTDYMKPGAGNLNESFSFALKLAAPLLIVQFLQSLVILGLAALAVLTIYSQPLVSLGTIFAVLYIAARLAPAPAVVIAEERAPTDALSRTWQITGGLSLHVLLGQVLMAIVFMIVTIAISVIVGIGLAFIITSLEVLILVTTFVTSLLLSPLNYIFQAVIYKDLEARDVSRDFNIL
ncbi:MAG: hypothetical protein ACTSU3_08255 [Candidatus Thorarchaeota archaeon]